MTSNGFFSIRRLALSSAAILLVAGCGGQRLVKTCNQDEATLHSFQQQMYSAIDSKKIYPAEAVAEHVQGTVEMSFDYISENKATNVKVVKSSGSIYLDAAALISVLRAELPAKPCGMRDVKHFVFMEQFGG